MNLTVPTTSPAVNTISSKMVDQHHLSTTSEPILANINIKIDKILKNNETVQRDINHLKIIIEDYKKMAEEIMQSNVDLQNENENLKRQIINVNYKIDNIEQKQIENNIVINGVEETIDESIPDITIALAKSLNVVVNTDDIIDTYRIKGEQNISGLPCDIVVQFKTNKIKTEIMESKKQKKINNAMLNDHMVTQCGSRGQTQIENRAIYI